MSKVKVENIVKTFNRRSRNANKVLKGVSFELPDKGLVCIFGKSGSGKTTLLNIIGGLEKADSGRVFIDGECTSGKTDRIRNAKIGFVFQNYYLEKGYTIAEILRNQMIIAGFKDEKEIARRTEEALKLVDMERFKNKLGDALSGGQQQRVAIARAIVKGSDVILADEPTGNLDAENTMKVMDILKEISRTQLVVIVTHEVSLIKKYADSHIKIVDGELVEDGEIEETDLAPATYDNVKSESKTHDVLTTFTKSTAKRNGRLFGIKSAFGRGKGDEEKSYSVGNVFKQIFILALAVVMTFFAYSAYEVERSSREHASVGENDVFVNLGAYEDLRVMDKNAYGSLDFFRTELLDGSFSYGSFVSFSGAIAKYYPEAARDGAVYTIGRAPKSGEVAISSALADKIKKELRLEEFSTDKSMLSLVFDDDYRVVGIFSSADPIVYMTALDYVNFIGVYGEVKFADYGGVFFGEDYAKKSYSSEIVLAADDDANSVTVEISRSALYKMLADPASADVAVQKANKTLETQTTAVYITDSKPLYVKKFEITRDSFESDVRIHVGATVLDNVFACISPNVSSAKTAENSEFFFKLSCDDAAQCSALKTRLYDKGIARVDVNALYAELDEEAKSELKKTPRILGLVFVLMCFIWYFIEKSGSIRNSKEYGIYRAIGVNKGNLLFKEFVSSLAGSISFYLLFVAIVTTLIAVRYYVANVAYGFFIGLAAAGFAVSGLLLVGISLIPYLFVLFESPSEILARYDI